VTLAPDQVTTDVAEGVAGADVVLVAVPAYGHEYYARELAGAVEPDQLVVIPTDNFGSLRFRRAFGEQGTADVTVAGASICPFPGLSDEPGVVDTHGAKDSVPLAALPGGETDAVVETLNSLFRPDTAFTPADDVLEVNLQNLNPYMHSAINVFNLSLIDAAADWLYYGEGCTPAVERLVAAIDEERLALAEALDVSVGPLRDLVAEMYESSVSGDTVVEMLGESPVHRTLPGPTDLSHEYITEDVPYGLVPLASLCREVGVSCPVLESTIELLSVGTGTDFTAEGITCADLGLAGLDREALLATLGRDGGDTGARATGEGF
jgi:opine dehydrogenase